MLYSPSLSLMGKLSTSVCVCTDQLADQPLAGHLDTYSMAVGVTNWENQNCIVSISKPHGFPLSKHIKSFPRSSQPARVCRLQNTTYSCSFREVLSLNLLPASWYRGPGPRRQMLLGGEGSRRREPFIKQVLSWADFAV